MVMDTQEPPPHIPGLPENAYRLLRSGEVCEPIVPAESSVSEVSLRSILFGLAMTVTAVLQAWIGKRMPGFENSGRGGNWTGLAVFAALGAAVCLDARRQKS